MSRLSRLGWLSLLACLAPALAQNPTEERGWGVVVRPFRELDGGGGYGEQAQRAMLDALSRGNHDLTAQAEQPDTERRWACAIDGAVSRRNERFTIEAHCTGAHDNYLVGSAVSVSGPDLKSACRQAVTDLVVRLTGRDGIGTDADRSQVSNDRGSARLAVRFGLSEPGAEGRRRVDERQAAGFLPLYLKLDRPRLKVTSDQPGHILVLNIGASRVWQLYPPRIGDAARIEAGQTLDLPDQLCTQAGWDPRGYELSADGPSVERIHVFFSYQPIRTGVKDMREALGDEAQGIRQQLTIADYYGQALPRLRQELALGDPEWTGASFGYYNAGTVDNLPPDPPILSRSTVAGGAARLRSTPEAPK